MKQESLRKLTRALCLLAAFLLWTLAVGRIDVQPIGLDASPVGFATINAFFHRMTGVHLSLYIASDWLSLIPIFCALGFALLGLAQWLMRKSLLNVDRSLLILGGFYLVVMTAYVFFEIVVINYRPVWIDGIAEASYPSSTTLLMLCVMPTTAMQLKSRISTVQIRQCVVTLITVFTVLMVAFRLFSGVHWLTDIIGGVLLSTGLVMLYDALISSHT